MRNCLVSKLKVEVPMDNPQYLDALNMTNTVYSEGDYINSDLTFRVGFIQNSSLVTSSGGNFTDSGGQIIGHTVPVAANTTTDIYFTNGTYSIAIKNLSKLVYLRFPDTTRTGHNVSFSLKEIAEGANEELYYLNLSAIKKFKEGTFSVVNFARFANLQTLATTQKGDDAINGLLNDLLDIIAPNRTTSNRFICYSRYIEIKKQDDTIITVADIGGICSVEFSNGNYRIYRGVSGSSGGELLYDSSLD